MSVYSDLVGQEKAIATLEKSRKSMTHAWLFTGPPGSGRSNLAIAFAASLICPNQGCGICSDCVTAKIGSHPDVEIFSTDGVTIKVDEIRELVSRSSWGASVSSWRVTVIEDSDRMTESAANALLKALEEPGKQSIWLLCAPTPDDVLPTIRSRCRLVSLTTPTTHEVSRYLQEHLHVDKAKADLIASISQGHIGRARHYINEPQTIVLRKKVINLLLSIKNETTAIAVAAQIQEIASTRAEIRNQEQSEKEEEQLRLTVQGPNRGLLTGRSKALKELEKSQKSRATRATRDELDSYFLWLQSLIHDAQILDTQEPLALVSPDLIEETETLRESMTAQGFQYLNQRIIKFHAILDSNASQILALESFALDFLSYRSGH